MQGRWIRRKSILGTIILATSLIVSATGTANALTARPNAAATHVLKVARVEQDMSLDPAVWYGAPNNDAEDAVYQNLLTYKGDTNVISPNLALSWTVSANGLTYTFKLRPGVTFHDGTAFNSTAVKFSWAREISIGQGASYMVADVASMAAPSPLVFVVHLKTPNNAFLDYLCSPYGPKIVSPTAVMAHAGNNQGQTWLMTHDAGTGPYTLNNVINNQSEVLQWYPKYWGPKPYYTTIDYAVVPSETTQLLELESGQLDMVTAGLTPSDLQQFKSNSKFSVNIFPADWTTYIFLNPHKGIFTNHALRVATMAALNAKLITAGARGPAGVVPTQYSPYDMLPTSLAKYNIAYDPSKLTAMAKTMSNKTVTIWWDMAIPADQEAADLVQAELEAAGMNAKVVTSNDANTLALPGHPNLAPDITVISLNLDTANAANYFQVYQAGDGILNENTTDIPAANTLIAKAVEQLTTTAADADYAKAAALAISYSATRPITDCESAVIARKGIVVAHDLLDPYGVDFAAMKAS